MKHVGEKKYVIKTHYTRTHVHLFVILCKLNYTFNARTHNILSQKKKQTFCYLQIQNGWKDKFTAVSAIHTREVRDRVPTRYRTLSNKRRTEYPGGHVPQNNLWQEFEQSEQRVCFAVVNNEAESSSRLVRDVTPY